MTTNGGTPVGESIAALPDDALLRFLAQQRWFASKGASPRDARITSVAITPWGNGAFAIARIAVTAGGADHLYQLPLAARASVPGDVPPGAIISNGRERPALYDAVHDSEFRAGLAKALAVGASAADRASGRWIAEPMQPAHFVVPEGGQTRVIAGEQSNTSIVIGDVAIFKLFRTLKPGIQPDVELTRFLTTRAGFTHTPALLATTRFEDGDAVVTSGMLQTFLPGSIDAWTYTLDRARPYFAAPITRDAPNAFIDDAKRLGVLTRAMHDALASDDDDPDFAAEPVTPEDLDRWAQRAQTAARQAMDLLEQQFTFPAWKGQRLAEAQALVRRRDHYLGWIDEIDDSLGDDLGMQIRVHGDFHLGQVLRTPDGAFAVIDFEGEPSRSLEERRERASPLRDVAGMLRSFAYAAATLALSVEKTIDVSTREIRSARWERDVRAAYLAGYLGHPDDDAPDILPEEAEHVHQLIALFETEKAFYELAYELNNRPDWAWIPMRGISKLFMKRS